MDNSRLFEQIKRIKEKQKEKQKERAEQLSIIVDQLYNNAEKKENEQRMGTMLQESHSHKEQEHCYKDDGQS